MILLNFQQLNPVLIHIIQAFRHSHYALQELCKPDTSLCTVVDVLRLCSKACVVKRKFNVAGKLIKHAVSIAS